MWDGIGTGYYDESVEVCWDKAGNGDKIKEAGERSISASRDGVLEEDIPVIWLYEYIMLVLSLKESSSVSLSLVAVFLALSAISAASSASPISN